MLVLGLIATPIAASAQSSQFGVRGLGMPARPISARAFATGGAFSMFDVESSVNPASLGRAPTFAAQFNILQEWRHVENPAGSESVRQTRFPHMTVEGPIKRAPAVLGISFSSYTNRDFTLASVDTVSLRGVLVPVSDTLASRGGVSDLRFAGAYRMGNALVVGGGFHILTGTNRLRARRTFSDTTYQVASESTELSFAGVGVSLGLIRDFGSRFSVAASVRSDGKVDVDRDSSRVGSVDLPYTFGLGMRWRAGAGLDLATGVVAKTWSGANSDLLTQNGNGAENTIEASLGAELTPDPRRPNRTPIRLGARYGTLPFPLVTGEQPHELGLSIGTGVLFAQRRASVEAGLEHVWRSEGDHKERAFMLDVAVTVRP
jgi:hypothetical protein